MALDHLGGGRFHRLFSWLYLRDDELLPDDDLIVALRVVTEDENGYDLVMGSAGAWRIDDEAKQWYGDFFDGKAPWDAGIANEILSANAGAAAIIESMELRRVSFGVTRDSLDQWEENHGMRMMVLAEIGRLVVAQSQAEENPEAIAVRLSNYTKLADTFLADSRSLLDFSLGVFMQRAKGDMFDDVVEGSYWSDEAVRKALHEIVAEPLSDDMLRAGLAGEYQLYKKLIVVGVRDGTQGAYDATDIPTIILKENRTLNLLAERTRYAIGRVGEYPMNLDEGILVPELPSRSRRYAGGNALGELLVWQFGTSSFYPMMKANSAQRAWDSLLAAKLALREYDEVHGKLPGSLNALVPDFLSELPVDWMDGQPIRYDAARAVLWSIGEDLVDDDGDPRKHLDECLELKWKSAGNPWSGDESTREGEDTISRQRVVLSE